jgi:hypothetical protein
MKKALIFLTVLGLAASLGAQSVADLAKREKERREALKSRHAVVVKNADLLRVQKLPAVEVTNPGATPGAADQAVPPSGSGGPIRRIVPHAVADGPTIMDNEAATDPASSGGTLEARLKSATDLVDLLTLKMNALRQQFEAQDAMVPGSVIQEQMADTNQRLVKAQAQQAKLQAEMEKKGLAKKGPGDADR